MSVFPFISPPADDAAGETTAELPLCAEWAYDYDNNRLLLRDGRPYLVYGQEAVKIWIYWALHTQRYTYTAYSTDYGCEAHTLIGQTASDPVVQSELRRYIIETLMVNPYIQELSQFEFTPQPAGLRASFCCRTVYGSDTITTEVT